MILLAVLLQLLLYYKIMCDSIRYISVYIKFNEQLSTRVYTCSVMGKGQSWYIDCSVARR